MANYTTKQWQVQVGPYSLDVAARPADQAYAITSIAIEPGVYTWQARLADGDSYLADATDNSVFGVTVAAEEIYPARLRNLPPGASPPPSDSES